MKNIKNNIICISGPSGVGKTTIAKLLTCILEQEAIVISGDDSHKWSRKSKNWERYTHLDPSANNLEEEKEQLNNLKNNINIKRRHYNHNTGLFDPAKEISPVQNIIYEGLHTLYDDQFRNLCDIGIYVDTDEELKIAWKLKRDLKERGYTKKQVYEAIKKRTDDEKKYILPQKKHADIVIKFSFSESGVKMKYKTKSDKHNDMLEKLSLLYEEKKKFVDICHRVSKESSLVQNSGGNISVKFNGNLLITSSGCRLSKVGILKNCCFVKKTNGNIIGEPKPSMEMGSHIHLNKSVIHTHPVNLLAILCSMEAKEIINKIYKDYKFEFLDYITPGKEVENCVAKRNKKSNVLFLKNHGLFVTSSSLESCLQITKEINSLATEYLKNNKKEEMNKNSHKALGHLFPDSVVLPKINEQINNEIYKMIIESGLTPCFLTKEDQAILLNLEEEKYRIKMESKNEDNLCRH